MHLATPDVSVYYKGQHKDLFEWKAVEKIPQSSYDSKIYWNKFLYK